MVRPERRTTNDLIVATALAVVLALVIALFWWNSSARTTTSSPAANPAADVVPAKDVPEALTRRWTAASPRTASPIVVGRTVVTGGGRIVEGRDPQSGQPRWSYARDSELCGLSYVYELAVAVYPDRRGCGQVSGITAATGRRGPTRSSYADDQVIVTSDGNAVLSAGPTRLELWRSDLVRMLSYGEIDARVKPVNQGLGTGCTLMSASASDAAAAVLEACKTEDSLRLTLLKPAKEEDEPDVKHVALQGLAIDSDARVLAVSGNYVAVYLPVPRPEVAVYDETGTRVAGTPLRSSPTLTGAVPAVSRPGEFVTWWTGEAVLVFDKKLGYRYTLDFAGPLSALGPATMMAGKFLVPVAAGLAVYDPANGNSERVIALTHPAGVGPVMPTVSGSMVIEQRGPELAGFGPA